MDFKPVVSESNRDLLDAIVGRLAQMRAELKAANGELESHLPDVEAMGSEDLLASLVGQLKSCASHWATGEDVLSALYMEFGGDTIDPFDDGGLFWGYGIGQKPDVIDRELFETSGVLVMDRLFEGMQALRERFPEHSYEIKEYMKVNAYVLLNVAFDRFVESDEFAALNTGDPLLFLAAEHDHNRKLIYRMQS